MRSPAFPLSILLVVAALLVAGCVQTGALPTATPSNSPTPTIVACTMEAKICPDGSAVGRVGPNCEFAPCPSARPSATPTASPASISARVSAQMKYALLDYYGESNLFFCDPDFYPVGRGDEAERAQAMLPTIQNDTGTFLAITARLRASPPLSNDTVLAIYREFKRLRAITLLPLEAPTSYAYDLQAGTSGERQGRRVSGRVSANGQVTELGSQPVFLTCPICLSGDTRIATPTGSIAARGLKAGMLVWTRGLGGSKISVPILRVSKVPVPSGHQMVRLTLWDGREVRASPGHPTLDGRRLGELRVGDWLDGARVMATRLVPYDEESTYDLLPAGGSGAYWADGILLGSTLSIR